MTDIPITEETLVTQAEDVVSAEIDDEVVMLRLASNAYYSTDDIGAKIWRAMETPISVRALCDKMMARYDVSPDICYQDVVAFLNKARAEGTIRIVAPDTRSDS